MVKKMFYYFKLSSIKSFKNYNNCIRENNRVINNNNKTPAYYPRNSAKILDH